MSILLYYIINMYILFIPITNMLLFCTIEFLINDMRSAEELVSHRDDIGCVEVVRF